MISLMHTQTNAMALQVITRYTYARIAHTHTHTCTHAHTRTYIHLLVDCVHICKTQMTSSLKHFLSVIGLLKDYCACTV